MIDEVASPQKLVRHTTLAVTGQVILNVLDDHDELGVAEADRRSVSTHKFHMDLRPRERVNIQVYDYYRIQYPANAPGPHVTSRKP
jgi:hypothetical protein